MGDEATTPFLSRIGGEIFQNYGLFPIVRKEEKRPRRAGGRTVVQSGAGGHFTRSVGR